jgi:hypothetical protein
MCDLVKSPKLCRTSPVEDQAISSVGDQPDFLSSGPPELATRRSKGQVDKHLHQGADGARFRTCGLSFEFFYRTRRPRPQLLFRHFGNRTSRRATLFERQN